MRGGDIGMTDNYLVKSTVQVKLVSVPQHKSNKLYDSNKLKNREVQEAFNDSVNSRLSFQTPNSIEEQWQQWKNAVHYAAECSGICKRKERGMD